MSRPYRTIYSIEGNSMDVCMSLKKVRKLVTILNRNAMEQRRKNHEG